MKISNLSSSSFQIIPPTEPKSTNLKNCFDCILRNWQSCEHTHTHINLYIQIISNISKAQLQMRFKYKVQLLLYLICTTATPKDLHWELEKQQYQDIWTQNRKVPKWEGKYITKIKKRVQRTWTFLQCFLFKNTNSLIPLLKQGDNFSG